MGLKLLGFPILPEKYSVSLRGREVILGESDRLDDDVDAVLDAVLDAGGWLMLSHSVTAIIENTSRAASTEVYTLLLIS